MADVRNFYLDPSVIINQNSQQIVNNGMNVQDIQGDLLNAAGDTIFNTGDLTIDANGVMPGDMGYITTVAPSEITNLGTLGNVMGDTSLTIAAPVTNSRFEGASDRLNVNNITANGAIPLNALGRVNYDVVTITEPAYALLTPPDANTLYLIREMIP